jgi:hypothetical protein
MLLIRGKGWTVMDAVVRVLGSTGSRPALGLTGLSAIELNLGKLSLFHAYAGQF